MKRATASSEAFAPELCLLVDVPPSGPGWLHEPKWDGYRLLTACAKKKVRLWSRNAIEWTHRVPEIVAAIEALGATTLQLDGELVAIGADGKHDAAAFNSLQAKLSGEGPAQLLYVVFDVVALDGDSLVDEPLIERKRVLRELLARSRRKVLREGQYQTGDGPALLATAVREGHEGLVSKRTDSTYRAGRSDDWRKCRPRAAEELAIVGYTEPRGSRVGIGAVVMGRRTAQGEWEYAGRVGAGLDQKKLIYLAKTLPRSARSTPPVTKASLAAAGPDARRVHWVEPKLTVEIEHHGRGNQGLLRQPSVKAIRLDKRAADLDARGDRAPDGAHELVLALVAKGVAWSEVVSAAKLVQETLKTAGLAAVARLTVNGAVQVVVPLVEAVSKVAADTFASSLARALSETQPRRFAKTSRQRGKIAFDDERAAADGQPITWRELAAAASEAGLRALLEKKGRRRPSERVPPQSLPRVE